MAMYVTKVWGFVSQDWPLVTFSREGTRDRLRGLWQPGDTMLFVGTQNEPTEPDDRGRVLGYAEFTSIPVPTREVVHPELLRDNGDKWPFALVIVRAWRILSPPLFKDLLPESAARAPGITLASGFDLLTGEEESRVRTLQVVDEPIPLTPAAERAAAKTDLIAWLKRRRGPSPPEEGSYTATRRSQLAKTYLLEWTSHNLMKIGWAIDPQARALHLSEPLVPEITGERWRVVLTEDWEDERAAHLMEQSFIDNLIGRGIRMHGEYFEVPSNRKIVEVTAWLEAMIDARSRYRRGDGASSS